MTKVKFELDNLPMDVGFVFDSCDSKKPKRLYDGDEIEKAIQCIGKRVYGLKDVDLLVVGYMPHLMPAKIAAWCKDAGIISFRYSLPGGTVNTVYDRRIEA